MTPFLFVILSLTHCLAFVLGKASGRRAEARANMERFRQAMSEAERIHTMEEQRKRLSQRIRNL